MARGWESKSVESQVEDGRAEPGHGTPLTAEQRAAWQKRQDLELARKRVVHEIEAARSVVRRNALEQALAHLEREIAKLPER